MDAGRRSTRSTRASTATSRSSAAPTRSRTSATASPPTCGRRASRSSSVATATAGRSSITTRRASRSPDPWSTTSTIAAASCEPPAPGPPDRGRIQAGADNGTHRRHRRSLRPHRHRARRAHPHAQGVRARGDGRAPRAHPQGQPDDQRHRRQARRRRLPGAGRRRRSARREGRDARPAARAADRVQGPAAGGRLPADPRIADLQGLQADRGFGAGRAAAPRRRGRHRQDQHPGIRDGVAHLQPRLRHHPQSLRSEQERRRIERRRRRGAGLGHAADRRRQRHGRLAQEPRQLQQRRRHAADRRPGADRAEPAIRCSASRPTGRWRARSPTWPCS